MQNNPECTLIYDDNTYMEAADISPIVSVSCDIYSNKFGQADTHQTVTVCGKFGRQLHPDLLMGAAGLLF